MCILCACFVLWQHKTPRTSTNGHSSALLTLADMVGCSFAILIINCLMIGGLSSAMRITSFTCIRAVMMLHTHHCNVGSGMDVCARPQGIKFSAVHRLFSVDQNCQYKVSIKTVIQSVDQNCNNKNVIKKCSKTRRVGPCGSFTLSSLFSKQKKN